MYKGVTQMTTQQLGYFIKLAEELNYTNVANYFYITQPTLSRQIINLESELGFPLFIREKNKVILTPEGRDFYYGILPVTDQLHSLISEIHHKYCTSDHHLTIAIMDEQLISPQLLLSINALRQDHPDFEIRFDRNSHHAIWNGLLTGKYDLINCLKMPQSYNEHIQFLMLEHEKTYIAIEKSLEPELPDIISSEETKYLLRKYPLYLPDIEKPASLNPVQSLLQNLNIDIDINELHLQYAGHPLSLPMHIIAKMGITITNQSNLYYVDPHIRVFEVSDSHYYEKGIFYNNESENEALHLLLKYMSAYTNQS